MSAEEEPQIVEQEIESDVDDDPNINVIGNIPREWYDEFDHIGWTKSGDKVIPKERRDPITELIQRSRDPEWFKTIYDPNTGEYAKVSDEILDFIAKFKAGQVTIPGYNLHQPFFESTYADSIHPLTNKMEPKRRFQPSKSEIYQISRFAQRIRNGEDIFDTQEDEPDENFDVWSADYYVKPQKRHAMNAPKEERPLTNETYNSEGGARLLNVPQYRKLLTERFDRMSNLYLCPRRMQARMPDSAAELLPEMPDASELKPYPTAETIRYVGHTGRVRCIDVSTNGMTLVSGSSDGEIRLWEVMTGRCTRVIKVSETDAVTSVAFMPQNRLTLASPIRHLVAYTCGRYIYVMRLSGNQEDNPLPPEREEGSEKIETMDENTMRITYHGTAELRQVTFSANGRFLAVLGQDRNIHLYKTNEWDVRTPITSKGSRIQCIKFHPEKTALFVATQHHVILFDLKEKRKMLLLRPNVQWISSISIHPRGDHVLAGSYDGKSFWFDTELSAEPFKVLRGHEGAVRDVEYHPRFPLFATASDDALIDVFHGQIYDDLITNPLIVPVKELAGHEKNDVLGVLCLKWHRTQPWLFSGGADHTIRLWC